MQTKVVWASWVEWEQRCALGLISKEAREQLELCFASRFRAALRRVEHAGLLRDVPPCPPARDCAHWLETYCALHQRREGKSYKRWLIERGEHSGVESGLSLLMRMVLREWLRVEQGIGRGEQHWVQGLWEDAEMERWVPDPRPAGISQELRSWAQEQLPRWQAGLTAAERSVLRLRHEGRPLYDRSAGSRGAGKSQIYAARRQLWETLAAELQAEAPDLEPAQLTLWLQELLDELGKQIFRTETSGTSGKLRLSQVGEANEH